MNKNEQIFRGALIQALDTQDGMASGAYHSFVIYADEMEYNIADIESSVEGCNDVVYLKENHGLVA